ncbi:unnamed protein product [Sphagnum jensenii]|uniref:Metallothionein n=1 Tax=Sphagnum jensenii TaxID=128206 RepID=A0ABP0WTS4_9BRYO
MSGCGNAKCSCGSACTCGSNCKCGSRTMVEPTFGGLRNYNMENDCKCGPNCSCATCDCRK